MDISLKWLNEYFDRAVEVDETERVLTGLGFPVEGRTEFGDSGDVVLDIEVTSNRGDMLSYIGVARDLAAGTGRRLVEPSFELNEESGEVIESVTRVDNEALDLCPLYTVRLIRGVKIGPSPGWLIERIESIGLRSVNNVVDITNFVMYETGQPLHAFDFGLLKGGRVVVRRAIEGEAFVAIDGTKHRLESSMLVIGDAERAVAVAGIMGGLDSEVSDDTVDILLESAVFAHDSIRNTSRALKLSSDSSYRFERRVDSHSTDRSSRRATQLILELAGGELAKGVIIAGSARDDVVRASLRPSRCNRLLGYKLESERMVEYLAALGLEPKFDGEKIDCVIPSYRMDLSSEADLIEEVARMHGYDHIEVQPDMHLTIRGGQASVVARGVIGHVLASHGYFETVTFSTISDDHSSSFVENGIDLVHLADDTHAERTLRPSTLPGLLRCRKINQDVGNNEVRLYEVASSFGKKNGEYAENRELAFLADVDGAGDGVEEAMRELRGTVEELAEALGKDVKVVAAKACPAWAKVAAWVIDADNERRIIGMYGVASDAIMKQFDLQRLVVMGWLDYELMIGNYPRQSEVATLQRFPGIERDLSLIVDESMRWSKIEACVDAADPDLMESLDFVGVYRGKQIGAGRKSVTLRMTFCDPSKTLTHDEVDGQVEHVVSRVKKELGAELRST